LCDVLGQRKNAIYSASGFAIEVDELIVEGGAVTGVRGALLADDPIERGKSSSREIVGDFEYRAHGVIVASGGIGGNHDLVRKNWPARLGEPPKHMLSGVPAHVDGRMLGITERAGGRLINEDRMWHYVEGIENWAPIWPMHAIRILPGPSALWFDACGNRLPGPLWPGFDTLGTLQYLRRSSYDYSWFILDQQIIRREFALSGSEQNPDLTGKSWLQVLKRAVGKEASAPVEAFKKHGKDFVVSDNLRDLVAGMNERAGNQLLQYAQLRNEIEARDRQLDSPFTKDAQLMAIRNARRYRGDRLIRTASRIASLIRSMDPSLPCG
jgi:predicted oxidoreductase